MSSSQPSDPNNLNQAATLPKAKYYSPFKTSSYYGQNATVNATVTNLRDQEDDGDLKIRAPMKEISPKQPSSAATKKQAPEDPKSLKTFRDSDCSSQFKKYEKCVEDNDGMFDPCVGTWNVFDSCREDLY
eukprot:GILI01002332.1.p1 GENE.GILI01002332.1~~GILI01002332.1.p1  ORF type:complete len:147 (-),score=27.19 GILI01002332.1:133-522(-)